VEAALLTIINQSYKNIEILVINDGSTDQTLEKLIAISKTDSRIVLVNNESNIGLIKTLNKGMQLCKGEYIERFDADDLIGLNRIANQIAIIDANPKIELITSFATYITSSGKFHSQVPSFYCNSLLSATFLSLFECPLVHAGMLIKNDLLNEMKYNDQTNTYHIEDYDIFSRLLYNQVNLYIDTSKEQRYLYRRNPSSISNQNRSLQSENAILKSKENLQKILNYSIDESILKALVLKTDIKWTPQLVKSAFQEFENIKQLFYDKYKDKLIQNDDKTITNWIYLRKLKICTSIFFKGNIKCKTMAVAFLLYNSKMFLRKKILHNLAERTIWLINKIRFKN
jgi:glycosyltransferase involved in cell wall biosynthesis